MKLTQKKVKEILEKKHGWYFEDNKREMMLIKDVMKIIYEKL